MTQRTRLELLELIEALCEGTASPRDIARLEKLVLTDRECLRLYLEALELYGNLYWDAGGVGATESNPARRRTIQPKRFRRIVAAFGWVAVVLLIMCWTWLRQPARQGELAQNPNLIDSPTPDEILAPNGTPVPRVSLPPRPEKNEVPGALDSRIALTESPTSPILVETSDQAVVAFINGELKSGWDDQQVQPMRTADDTRWVRRVYLDLAGRIPTVEETTSFVDASRPDKRDRLVADLLESRDFARHYASTWTTLLVGRAAAPRIRRDQLLAYLTRQFGENRSWRETVTDLLTAEGSAEESGPANFLLAHLNNQAVPATAIAARTLLGEQLLCSQCHQHPSVAGWDQARFWQFNAFFQQTSIQSQLFVDQETGQRTRIRRLADNQSRGPTYYETLKGVMLVAYPEWAGVTVQETDEQTLRQQLAAAVCSGQAPQVARSFVNRSWCHLLGRGFTSPVDDMGPHNPPSHPRLLQGVTEAFVTSGYDVRKLFRWICLSDTYQLSADRGPSNILDAPEQGEQPLFSRIYEKPLSAEQLYDSLLIATGIDPDELDDRSTSRARQLWLQQFYQAVDTEENGEQTTFDGSVPQALMMMNGDLVQRAIDPQTSAVMRRALTGRSASQTKQIRELCLAALSREPTSDELTAIRTALRRHVKSQTEHGIPALKALESGLRDIYWAYLNSSEFTVNR